MPEGNHTASLSLSAARRLQMAETEKETVKKETVKRETG